MSKTSQVTIRVPRVYVNDPTSPKTFTELIKKLNTKYNIGFNSSTLIKELKEAIRTSSGPFDAYQYWEGRLIDSTCGRDDFDAILNEFQREAAKIQPKY